MTGETPAQKNRFHYAWLIFIGCCFLGSSGAALAGGLTAVYIVPVSKIMGLTTAQFAFWTTATGLTETITFPFWGQIIRKHLKLAIVTGTLCEVVGILSFTVANTVPQLIAIGVLVGIGLPTTFFLTIPTLMTNWFAPKYRGKFLGIAMAFSGVGIFIWSPLFTWVVTTYGHVVSYTINAILLAVLILPWALFVFKFTPEEVGLKPYGYDPEEEQIYQLSTFGGVSATKAFKTAPFYLMFVAIALTAIGMGFNNAQTSMAAEMLVNTSWASNVSMLAAWMLSTTAAGNMIGKIFYGALSSRIGLKNTTIVFMVMFFGAFAVWLIFLGQIVFMFIGSFLLGTHNGIISVGYPMIAREIFGAANYEKIYARLSIGSALFGGFGTLIVASMATNIFGSYITDLYVGFPFIIIISICVFSAIRFIGKVEWDMGSPGSAVKRDVKSPEIRQDYPYPL